MNNTSKNRKPGPSSEVTSVPFVDEAKLLLACCLVNLNAIGGHYFHEVIGTASIPGSLSHLLCVTDEQLMTIYRSCGFYIVKRNYFSYTILQVWINIEACISNLFPSSQHRTTRILPSLAFAASMARATASKSSIEKRREAAGG